MTAEVSIKPKALVVEEAGGPFKLVNTRVKIDTCRDDEVLVHFQASGICHTDLGSWSGKIPAPYPCILGHEGSGKVITVGKQYESLFSPGDSVIASFCSCGKCESCQRLEPACCDQFLPLNLAFQDHSNQPVKVLYEDGNNQTKEAHSKYFGQSSFANIMPVSGRSLTRISGSIPPKFACALACGFQTGFSTVVEKARGQTGKSRTFERYVRMDDKFKPFPFTNSTEQEENFEDETLLVTGLGAVGLGALVAGKMLKFGKVIACDVNEKRLQLVKDQIDVEEIVNPNNFKSSDEFVSFIKSKSKHQRGATMVIEASGSPKALKDGALSLAIGGKALIVGSPPPTALLEVPIGLILANIWTIEGVLMGNSEPSVTIPFLVSLFNSGKLGILNTIVQTYKPEDMKQAVIDAEKGIVIKPVIEWS